ncbi:retrotransposon protein, putative, ty1-copia subclass [Tanacetum coccineum]
MVRSLMSQTTLPKFFGDYDLESAACILNMVLSKKVEKTPYENVEFFKNSLISQEASRSLEDLEWLFKKKIDMDGNVHTYKARHVAKGFTQTYKIEYEETFSLVADIRPIRILITITAFDEEVKKSGFIQNYDEPCVYVKASRSNVTSLILYFNDILIMGNHISMLQDVKSYLGKFFSRKDLGEAVYILGIKIYRDRSRRLIGLCQSAYIENPNVRKANTKQGSRCFNTCLGELHSTAVKNILKYLRKTKDMFLVYDGDMTRELRVTDARYQTDVDDSKSKTGYVFVLNGGAVDRKSAKQNTISTSSIEAEYMVA